MRVDVIIDHFGRPHKEGKFAGDGPYEVTGDDLIELFARFDVGICHSYGPKPTRKERARGAAQEEFTYIHLDTKGGHFRQR